MTKLPLFAFIYDRYKKATNTVAASVELRITYNRKQKYISTGVRLLKGQWKRGTVIGRPDSMVLNQHLNSILIKANDLSMKMLSSNSFELSAFNDIFKMQKNTTFLDFCRKRAEVRKYGKEEDTKGRYNRFLKLFSSWGKIVDFKDVCEDNIILYDKYLTDTGMKPYSRWNNYHRFLNSFISDAIDEGLLQRNPYKWINIARKDNTSSLDKCLTLQEFRILEKAKMPTESLCKVRDVFVFQTYTCMRYSDMVRFNKENLTEINGIKVYKCCQKKTNKPAVIPLLSPALAILIKYNWRLPIISNVKYNSYLKVVAQAAGLDKPLTTHWARHTGATLLLNEGVDMRIVAKICGHSSMKITEQVYAKLLDETVVEAVKKLPLSQKT